jgi:hypothetical protein
MMKDMQKTMASQSPNDERHAKMMASQLAYDERQV